MKCVKCSGPAGVKASYAEGKGPFCMDCAPPLPAPPPESAVCTGCGKPGTQYHLSYWWCAACAAPKSSKVAAVIDPRGEGDAKIRALLKEILDNPQQIDACVVLSLFKDEAGRPSTKLELRNTSDVELGYLSAYLQAYVADRIREGHV